MTYFLPALDRALRAYAALHRRASGADGERGDVPGWVLITLMTAGLVTVLWALASSTLTSVFTNAIASVTGSGG